ncbi:MAG: hypothetical protein QW281_01545 [Saccharolobus sp.]
MNDIILAAYKKAKELNNDGDVYVFKDKHASYYLIIVKGASCKEKSKIINIIYDEVYKYTDEIDLIVFILDKDNFNLFMSQNKENLEKVL